MSKYDPLPMLCLLATRDPDFYINILCLWTLWRSRVDPHIESAAQHAHGLSRERGEMLEMGSEESTEIPQFQLS